MEDAVPLLVGKLGGVPHDGGPGIGFRGGQWEFAGGGRIEVIEPEGAPGGFLHRFLDSRGARIHHVTFKVTDIYRARDLAHAHGYGVTGFNDAFEGWKEMFLHPRQAQGIVVQLAQTHPTIPDDSWGRDFPFPPFAGKASPQARIVGLRLSARTAERARAQWQHLLGADCRSEDDRLVFTWSEAPIRIAVDVDANREEGPLFLEVDELDPTLDGSLDTATGTRLASSKR